MKIVGIETIPVRVPIHPNIAIKSGRGGHHALSPFLLVKVRTDEGIVGLGEMGGGGDSAEAAVKAMKSYVVGHDPARVEDMRFC